MNSAGLKLPAAPAFLTGAALILWGWQCDFLIYAVLMAILLEGTILAHWRWPITDTEFNTLSDFSGVMFFLVVVYIFSSEGARGIFVILQLQPFILFPLLVTQKYSVGGNMKLATLLVGLRKLDPELSPEATATTDISLPYFIVCLVSASAGNQRSIVFFIVVAVLISILLWHMRPRRYSLSVWFSTLLLALSTAYMTQIGLRHLQASIEASFMGIFDQFMWRYRDPLRSTTAIGALGRLKLSDRVVLRLQTKEKLASTMLVREATYSSFGHGIWSSRQADFRVIDQSSDGSWTLNEAIEGTEDVTISTYMVKEEGVIPVPHGSSRIKNITAIELAINPLGAVLMDIREGWIQFDVEYSGHIRGELPPDDSDLFLLDYYKADFERLASELRLHEMTPVAAVETVERYFSENFTYSLDYQQRYPKGRYLAKFLFETRQGHCEYFATATALLLRTAGIPTRYAVGYAVDEYSSLEGQYIARARDAHSWTLVYVNGQWQPVDTTPSVWGSYEDARASAIEPLMDIWSWLGYSWSLWQSADAAEEDEDSSYLLWLLLPLIAVLAWRIYFKERVYSGRRRHHKALAQVRKAGLDSEFYKLIDLMEQHCPPRRPGETLADWIRRLQLRHAPTTSTLQAALDLHYRYRFDPLLMPEAERRQLTQLVSSLLSEKENWLTGDGI